MRFFKLSGVALVVLCACAAAMATSAFALPTVLIGGGELAKTFTGKSIGATKLETPTSTVECSSASGEGTTEAKIPLGQFHIRFAGCKDLVACTGSGDSSGVILSLGSYHIVYDTLKGTELSEAGVAILYLPGTTTFNCSGFAEVTVKSGGMVLCLITNPTALTKVFTFGCGGSKGKPEESKYYNAGGTLVSISTLLSIVGTAAATESDQVGEGTDEFAEDVLIMI